MCIPNREDKLLTTRNGYALFEVFSRDPSTLRDESHGFRIDGPDGFESESVSDPVDAARRFLVLAPLPD